MRRALLALTCVLALCGCSSDLGLDEPRAYPCAEATGDATCPEGWRCGLDGQCHDTAVPATYACRTDADCEGGWRCGVDARCHARTPDAYACREDADCEGGWRCGPEARCVDAGGDALRAADLTTEPLQGELLGPTWVGALADAVAVSRSFDAGAGARARTWAALQGGALRQVLWTEEADGGSRAVWAQAPADAAPGAALAALGTDSYRTAAEGLVHTRLSPDGGVATAPLPLPFGPRALRTTAEPAPVVVAAGEAHFVLVQDGRASAAPFAVPRADGGVQRLRDVTGAPGVVLAAAEDGLYLARRDGLELVRAEDGGVRWGPVGAAGVLDHAGCGTPDGGWGAWRAERVDAVSEGGAQVLSLSLVPRDAAPGTRPTHVTTATVLVGWATATRACGAPGLPLEQNQLVAATPCAPCAGADAQATVLGFGRHDFASPEGTRVRCERAGAAPTEVSVQHSGGDFGVCEAQVLSPTPGAVRFDRAASTPSVHGLDAQGTPWAPPASVQQSASAYTPLTAREPLTGAALVGEGVRFTGATAAGPAGPAWRLLPPLGLVPAGAGFVRGVDGRPDWLVARLSRAEQGGVLPDLDAVYDVGRPQQGGGWAQVAQRTGDAPLPAAALLAPAADGGTVLVMAAGEALAAVRVDADAPGAGVAEVESRIVPQPGSRLVSLAAGPPVASADGGTPYLRGLALTRNSLFRVSASSEQRFRVEEVPVPEGDFAEVWFDGERGRVAYADGSVFSSDTRVRVATPLPAGAGPALDFGRLCRQPFALTAAGLYRLVTEPGAAVGTWRAEPALALPGAPVDLAGARLADPASTPDGGPRQLLVLLRDGRAVRLRAPGACP